MNRPLDPPAGRRHKVLLVTRNFPPLIGGMERLLHHAYQELTNSHDVALVGPRGCLDHVSGDRPVAEVSAKPIPLFLLEARQAARRLARRFNPDLVLAGSGLSLPAARAAGRHSAAPVVTLVHGLDLVHPNRLYRRHILPAVTKANHVIANSRNTMGLAGKLGVSLAKISVVTPGVSVPRQVPDATPLRRRLGLGDRPVILSVGRMTPRKGLAEFVEGCLPAIVKRCPDVCLLIVGDTPAGSAAKPGNAKEEIQRVVSLRGLGHHVLLAGALDDDSLAMAYSAAEVFVFPVLEIAGDVEGFGMVALEAAAYRLPTVAFAAGGVPDAVADGISGSLVQPGCYEEFSEQVIVTLGRGKEANEHQCLRYAQENSWARFGTRLRALCDKVIGEA